MTAPADRVQILKQESGALGGDATESTDYDTPLNPGEDAPEVQGVFYQPPGSTLPTRDETTYTTRDAAGNMVHADQSLAMERTLTQLAFNAHTISASDTIPSGQTRVVPRYLSIAAGVTLSIGSNADLEIT